MNITGRSSRRENQNTTYDTACEMDVTSDSVSSYGGLHEIQGSFDCSELVLHNEELTNSIACAAHFDVFVNVQS